MSASDTAAGDEPLIAVEGLWKTYQLGDVELAALRGVTLRVDEGEFVAVMGQSGSGKSTFMNLLGCLDTPTRGTVRLRGRDLSRIEPDERAELRMCPKSAEACT